jgi:hypothetical protein
MKFRIKFLLVIFPVCLLFLFFIKAPVQSRSFVPGITHPFPEKGLFDTDDLLQITLKGNIRDLFNDRTATPKLFPLVLSCTNEDSSQISIPVNVKTRGHFRRLKENCEYPPLMIQFPKQGPQLNSVFREQQKLKLVMPCVGDEYIVREWLVYKIYNLVTPFSFRARLVKIKLDDARNKKTIAPFYGILLEEEKQMAMRNHAVVVDKKLRPEQIKTDAFFKMSVFQYLIGNTDWSIQYRQNIKLLTVDANALPIAVPYDFDHSGFVNAPYAQPAEELLMTSVRQRRYRGYCVKDLNDYKDVLAEFNRLKNDIYKLYAGCELLDQKYLKSTIQYLDDFYKTIVDTKAWQKDFAYPCDKNGTGNVVIKGLKEE